METFGTFGTCQFFIQLSSGRWAALSAGGWVVSISPFGKGIFPDRFKHEPVREATSDEIEEAESHGMFYDTSSDKIEDDYYPEDSEIWGAAGF